MVLGHLLVSEWALRQVSEDTANVISVNGEMNKLGVEIDVGIDWRWYGCSVLVLELRELVSTLVLVWGLGVGVVSVGVGVGVRVGVGAGSGCREKRTELICTCLCRSWGKIYRCSGV